MTRRRSKAPSIAGERLEQRVLLAAVAWTGAGDAINWTDPANWNTNALPGNADDVTIAVPGSVATIKLTGLSTAVNSLACDENFTLNNATLTVAAASSIDGTLLVKSSTIDGGPWTAGNVRLETGVLQQGDWTLAGALDADLQLANQLNDVDLIGEIRMTEGVLALMGGSSFSVAHLDGGNSSLMFAPGSVMNAPIMLGGDAGNHSIQVVGAGTLTLGPNATIAPESAVNQIVLTFANSAISGADMTLVNQGTIVGAGKETNFLCTNVINQGTIQVTGPSAAQPLLLIRGNWNNSSGVINVSDVITLLQGSVTTAGLGQITRTGGKVFLSATVDNTNAMLTVNAARNGWSFTSVIFGGAMTFADGANFAFNSNGTRAGLHNVDVQGELNIGAGQAVSITGSTRFVALNLTASGNAYFTKGYTLHDPVHIISGSTVIEAKAVSGITLGATVTVASDATIDVADSAAMTLKGLNIADSLLVNDGAIQLNGSASMTVDGLAFNNNGSVIGDAGTVRFLDSPSTGPGGSGTISGSIRSGTIEFGRAMNLAASAIVAATTELRIVNATFVFPNGTLQPGAKITLRGTAVVRFADPLNGPTLAFEMPSTQSPAIYLDSLTASYVGLQTFGGVINVPNGVALNVIGSSASDSEVKGAARVVVTSGATLVLAGKLTTALDNYGTLDLLDNTITLDGSGAINNKPGALVTSSDTFVTQLSPGHAINNAGIFQQNSFSGSSDIRIAFNNTGILRNIKGTLMLSSGISSGTIEVVSPYRIEFANSWTYSGAATFIGTGALLFSGGHTLGGRARFFTGEIIALDSVGLDGPLDLRRLQVGSNGQMTVSAGGNLLRVGGLSVSTSGTFDLNDNDLLVDYTGSSPYNTIRTQIRTARAGGTWTGLGISSTAARNAKPKNTTLGVLTADEFKSIYGLNALFDGAAFDSTSVLVKYTYYGDTDFNGAVNFDDYSRTDAGFNTGRTGWLNGDFNDDGVVNFDDYTLIDLAFRSQQSPARRVSTRGVIAV